MIQSAFQFTKNVLQQFLKDKFGIDQEIVVCNTIADDGGSIPKSNQNKVILSLINIQKDIISLASPKNYRLNEGDFSVQEFDDKYNLDILVTSHFENYDESLKHLDAILEFFHINSLLEARQYSTAPKDISKLFFEFENNNYMDMQSLWNTMGMKFRPSVIYKMRLVVCQSSETKSEGIVTIQSSNT